MSFDHRRTIVLAVRTFPAIMAVRAGPRTRVENELTGVHPFFGPFIVGRIRILTRCFRCTIVPCHCRLSRFCAVNIPPRSARPHTNGHFKHFCAQFGFLFFGTNLRVERTFKYVRRKLSANDGGGGSGLSCAIAISIPRSQSSFRRGRRIFSLPSKLSKVVNVTPKQESISNTACRRIFFDGTVVERVEISFFFATIHDLHGRTQNVLKAYVASILV